MSVKETWKWLEREYYLLGASVVPLMGTAIYAGHSDNELVSKGVHTAIEIPYVYGVVEFMNKKFNAHPLVGIGTALAVKNFTDFMIYGQERNLLIATGAFVGGVASEGLRRMFKKSKNLEDNISN